MYGVAEYQVGVSTSCIPQYSLVEHCRHTLVYTDRLTDECARMGFDAQRILNPAQSATVAPLPLPDTVRQMIAERHMIVTSIHTFVPVLNTVYREHAMYMDKLRQTMQMLQLVGDLDF